MNTLELAIRSKTRKGKYQKNVLTFSISGSLSVINYLLFFLHSEWIYSILFVQLPIYIQVIILSFVTVIFGHRQRVRHRLLIALPYETPRTPLPRIHVFPSLRRPSFNLLLPSLIQNHLFLFSHSPFLTYSPLSPFLLTVALRLEK